MTGKRPEMSGRNRNRKQKGFAILVTAISLLFLLPVVGLAIDASLLYTIKAKLQASTDAAAIAAARTLSVGLTLAEQEASARNQALTFFAANFPPGFAETRNHNVRVDIAETAFRTRTVTVTAELDAPLYFLRTLFLSNSFTHISAMGKASRRDVNLVLVLDRSGSMNRVPTGSTTSACDAMRSAATYFVEQFAEGRDRLAMVTYNTATYEAFSPSMYFKTGSNSLLSRINAIACGGGTGTAGALNRGYQLLQNINEPGALNLIVLFTDGIPNGVTAYFPVKKKSDTRYGYGADNYTSTSTLYSNMPPSTCQDADGDKYDRRPGATSAQYSAPNWNPYWTPGDANGNLFGVLAYGGALQANGLGSTSGPYKAVSTTGANTSDLVSASEAGATITGCRFTSNSGYIRRDIAYIPDVDAFGNNLRGPYVSPDLFTTAGHPYLNRIRPDMPRAVARASTNAVDNQATTIRSNDYLKPVIYCIALSGNSGSAYEEPDLVLLRRVANVNDPSNSIYDPSRPEGLMVHAPSQSELNLAFARVASEILRLAQ